MKKLLLTITMAAATASVFAQGTVNFSNLSTALASPPDRMVRFTNTPGVLDGTVLSTNRAGAAQPGLRAQLFYGAAANEASMIAVTTAPASFKNSTSTTAGTWFGGTRTLTGFTSGSVVQLQVRVWDLTLAPDWATLQTMLGQGTYTGLMGKSAIFGYTVPTSPTPAPAEFNMVNFVGFTVAPVPEPSSIALAGLGLASLLIFRRRK